jgi:protein SHQ1
MRIHNKEYLVNTYEKNILLNQLTDILVAYCYELRTQDYEFHSESAWTINKISYTLSCFAQIESLKESLVCSVRRVLIFPFYRHWTLVEKTVGDLVGVLKLGRKFIVKALLEIKVLFERSEPRNLLNVLFIDDFIVWVQQLKEEIFLGLGSDVEKVFAGIGKENVGFDLEELEEEGGECSQEDWQEEQGKLEIELV